MSQTFDVPLNTSDAMSALVSDISTALDTLRNNFAGPTVPTSPTPVEGQPWWDSTNNLFYVYNGGVWTPVGGRVTMTPAYAGDLTLDAEDAFVYFDATAAARTATLPSAVGINGTVYTIGKSDSSMNAVLVSGTINGSAQLYILRRQYDAVSLVSDGAGWRLFSRTPIKQTGRILALTSGTTGF
jgi:hypothetical protein